MPKKARRGRGEGSYHQRDNGLWVGRISLGYDGEGKRIRRTVYGKTKGEARNKILALQQDSMNGLPVKPQKLTVSEHFEDWLRAKKPSIRESTFSSYRILYATHLKPALGQTQLKGLDYRKINAFLETLDQKGLSRRSVAYVSFLLRSSLEDAVRKGIIPANPAKLASTRTQGRKEARSLNQYEIRALLDAAKGERLVNAFLLAIYTGLRPGEWLGLCWDAIDWDGGKLTVKRALLEINGKVSLGEVKTDAGRRTISLPPTAIGALKNQRRRQTEERLASRQWDNPHNLVFTNENGGPLRRTSVARRDFKPICHKAGLAGVTLHTLRHSHASILIFEGVDIKAISKRLGHENIAFTLQVYGHLLPGQDERAADAVESFINSL